MGKLNNTSVELSTKKKKMKRHPANEAMSSTPIKDLESIDKIYSENDTLKHKKPKLGHDRSVIIQDNAQEEQKDNLLDKSLKMPSQFAFESSISEKTENNNQSVTSVLLDNNIVESSTKKKKKKKHSQAEPNDNLLNGSLKSQLKITSENLISDLLTKSLETPSKTK